MIPIMISIADFLNTILFSNSFVYLNYWSLIHIIFGAGIMYLFLIDRDNRFIKLFGLLLLYELFEWVNIYFGTGVFRAESYLDIFYDIGIGLFGGWIVIKLRKKDG